MRTQIYDHSGSIGGDIMFMIGFVLVLYLIGLFYNYVNSGDDGDDTYFEE